MPGAVAELERSVLAEGGVVLRYGPGVWLRLYGRGGRVVEAAY
jgi:hypothetical protein